MFKQVILLAYLPWLTYECAVGIQKYLKEALKITSKCKNKSLRPE